MLAIFFGILFVAFAVFATLPAGLDWGAEIIAFLKGGMPIAAALIGLVSFFIGIADLKDKAEAKKEEEASQAND
ncbi:MAG: hypothetical protein GX297_01205 [Treponema sp.]|jgi:hypothetical protein|nr:hypothetical protein [Treponema sp.]